MTFSHAETIASRGDVAIRTRSRADDKAPPSAPASVMVSDAGVDVAPLLAAAQEARVATDVVHIGTMTRKERRALYDAS